MPRLLIENVIYFHHDTPESAHPGRDETTRRIMDKYFFKNIHKTVGEYVRNCVVCMAVKKRQYQKNAPLQAYTPRYPFEILLIDVLGPYNESRRGKKYILCVEDVFTRWIEAEAFPNVEAKTVTMFLNKQVFSRYGCPRIIISDNGSQFNSGTYRQFCEKYKIERFFTPIFHQQSNPVERRNQELKKVLRTLLEKSDYDWDKYLNEAVRVRKNQATGMTPAKALLGFELAEPGDWLTPMYLDNQLEQQQITYPERIQQATENQDKYQEKYVGDHPDIIFEVGDNVMAREKRYLREPFGPVWSDPFQIIEKLSDLVYVVLRDGKPVKLHVNDLRPFPVGNPVPDLMADSDSESVDQEIDPLQGKDLPYIPT